MLRGERHWEGSEGPFGRTAFDLCAVGLSPTPTSGADGKKPLLRGYNKIRITPANVAEYQKKFGAANIALVTGLSGINVLDIDEPDLLPQMRRRFGDSPLIVKTAGRGGFQIYYRSNQHVRLTDLRYTEGLPVEIKAAGSIVIAPPSHNPKQVATTSLSKATLASKRSASCRRCTSKRSMARRQRHGIAGFAKDIATSGCFQPV